jgi:glycosyltransferase involved in cell wall biosynthesis
MQDSFPIVYFGNDWFAENRTSSHHIARRLAQRFPLLYVECPGLRAPRASSRDVRKLCRKLLLSTRLPRRLPEGPWLMTLPQIPYRRRGAVEALNRWLAQRLVFRAIRHLSFDRPLLWFTIPHVGFLAGHLQERLVVYYCTDDYSAFPGVDSQWVARMDSELTHRADQLFVTSRSLHSAKVRINPTAHYSPHGVDAEHFARACDPDLPVPKEVKALKHPIIGFFGLIETWIDLDLIAFLAKARRDWTFVMIGRLAVEPGELGRQRNVILSGPQRYEGLPNWVKAFDVAIAPFRGGREVYHANPLKLREYLAAGKPVVSTWMPEAESLAHCIAIAREPCEFLRHVEHALLTDSAEERMRRQQTVASCTWEARVTEVLEVIDCRLRVQREREQALAAAV